MEKENDLQIENGNYTRIVNKVIDELVKTPLLGVEMSICIFVIRKTYGFKKTQDEISLTQFEKGIKRSRPTIVKALKNLQLVNILQLVKAGDSKAQSSLWRFNKYYKTWKLVNRAELVKHKSPTSKVKGLQLVKPPLHTKDNTKEIIQKRGDTPAQHTKNFFKGIQDIIAKTESPESLEAKRFMLGVLEKYPDARKEVLWDEIKKFYNYWTELNATGTKQRWQKQETFEVMRRLATWVGKIKEFEKKSNLSSKYKAKMV